MPDPQGLMSFPGVEEVISGTFTLSHGIAPSAAHLTVAPQFAEIPVNGVLQLSFGQAFLLRFRDCRVSNPSIIRNESGRILSFGIFDRRWKWAFGEVYGRYNLKRADGSIDTLRSDEKTPQDLARVLLRAMGESNVDVSAIPNTLRPTCVWNGENPAAELAQLLDDMGCRIGLCIDDRVRIWRLGEGRDLPYTPTLRTSGDGLSITGVPDSIKTVCGPTRYQSKFLLQAVGLDRDGRTKPIEKLSYRPSGGWGSEWPDGFWGIANLADRRLALRSVWRWFRIKQQAEGGLAPIGFPAEVPVTSIQQLLPLSSELLSTELDQRRDPNDLLTRHPMPAYVEGSFLKRDFSFGMSTNFSDIQKGATVDGAGNTTIGARYVGSFSLDGERGIVEFSDWVVKLDADYLFVEPELYLTCSYSVRNASHMPYRHAYEVKLASRRLGTGPQIVAAEDIERQVIISYGPDGKSPSIRLDNRTIVERWAKELADAAARQYQTPQTEEAEYAGWDYFDVDGAVQQVQFEFGPGGAKMRASRNTEFDEVTIPYRERREADTVKAFQHMVYRDRVIRGAK